LTHLNSVSKLPHLASVSYLGRKNFSVSKLPNLANVSYLGRKNFSYADVFKFWIQYLGLENFSVSKLPNLNYVSYLGRKNFFVFKVSIQLFLLLSAKKSRTFSSATLIISKTELEE